LRRAAQPPAVRQLASAAGFHVKALFGNRLANTTHLENRLSGNPRTQGLEVYRRLTVLPIAATDQRFYNTIGTALQDRADGHVRDCRMK
jgi:hypothetical protein